MSTISMESIGEQNSKHYCPQPQQRSLFKRDEKEKIEGTKVVELDLSLVLLENNNDGEISPALCVLTND